MGMGTLRLSYLALLSTLFIACGKDESGGSDDDDDAPVTTNTATTTPTSTTAPTTNTSTNTTNPNGSSTTSPNTTTGSSGGSGGSGGSDNNGGSGQGGSAGDQANVGGSGGAPGGSGGGTVVIEDDCSYEACGGDLADTEWSYSRLCVERDALLAGIGSLCATVELISSSGDVTGTIGFTDDTYEQDASFSITGEFQVPSECNPAGCALIELALASVGGFSDPDCTASAGGGCRCSATLAGSAEVTADYSTDGDDLTLDGDEGTYCVSGDSFKYTGSLQGVEFVYETVPQ